MKKDFIKPDLSILYFVEEDVITTSAVTPMEAKKIMSDKIELHIAGLDGQTSKTETFTWEP